MIKLRIAIPIVLGLLGAGPAMGANSRQQCLGGLKPVLLAGGFTGSTDCQRDKLSIRWIGIVRAQGREFTVFDYRYQLAQICKNCAIHGGQRIIIFRSGRYVGQYKPDMVDVAVIRGNLVLSLSPKIGAPGAQTLTVRFTRHGPPKQVLFDGELLVLFR